MAKTPAVPETLRLAPFICLTVKVESNCFRREARSKGSKDSQDANAMAVEMDLLTASRGEFSYVILDSLSFQIHMFYYINTIHAH